MCAIAVMALGAPSLERSRRNLAPSTEELTSTKRNTNTNNYNESENRPPLSICNSFLSLELSVEFLECGPTPGRQRDEDGYAVCRGHWNSLE